MERREEKEAAVITVPKHLLSRLLYPNPVCLLTSYNPETGKHNVMTITWLTPVDNNGIFFASLNSRRFTAQLLKLHPHFVLSVPVKGMEEQVLKIGACSGRDTDKFESLSITTCTPGWHSKEETTEEQQRTKRQKKEEEIPRTNIAVEQCVAHMECVIESQNQLKDHIGLFCRIQRAFVRESYWSGSQQFAIVSSGV